MPSDVIPPRRSFPPPPSEARALVLRAHPLRDSFNHALAEAWAEGALDAGIEVETLDVAGLTFDVRLAAAYRADQPLEPDLQRVQQAIARAAHVVVAFPSWWSSTPAALKGLFDRILLPGWAFRYDGGSLPTPGLAGRTGRLIVTMDSPVWYDTLVYGGASRRQVARGTLAFCGIRPVRRSVFGDVAATTEARRVRMLGVARGHGVRDGRDVARRWPTAMARQAASIR